MCPVLLWKLYIHYWTIRNVSTVLFVQINTPSKMQSYSTHSIYYSLAIKFNIMMFIEALWSPTGKGLTSWHSLVMSNCVFVTFPRGILGHVWYLIVSITDLCPLSFMNAPFPSEIHVRVKILFTCKKRKFIRKYV